MNWESRQATLRCAKDRLDNRFCYDQTVCLFSQLYAAVDAPVRLRLPPFSNFTQRPVKFGRAMKSCANTTKVQCVAPT